MSQDYHYTVVRVFGPIEEKHWKGVDSEDYWALEILDHNTGKVVTVVQRLCYIWVYPLETLWEELHPVKKSA